MTDNAVEISVKLALEQFQAAANQLVATFGGAMTKVEADAAVTGGALDEAFRVLGVRSVGAVEAEVRKLQTALGIIKSMPGVLPADAERATQAFNQRLVELRGSLAGVPPAAGQVTAATNETAAALGNAAKQAVAWGAALVGLNSITDLAKKVIETGSAFEQLEGRLTGLLGSQEKAADAFARIKELAATTPFEVNALTEAYAKLTAFGMEPTMAQMRAFADTAATLGGGTQMLERVTLALGQAWTKGKLQGQEIMQMAEAGVPVWDLLAKATGRNVAELQKMSEAGQLGRAVIAQLIDEMGRMNDGASARLMDTYAGAVSNAKDATAEFFDLIARSGVLDYLTTQIQSLLAEFERMKETGELEQKAKALADGFIVFAEATRTAIEAVAALSGVIEFALKAFVAQKVLAFAGALRGIAAAAPAAGAAVAVAGGQMAAAGTAAAGAAASVGLLTKAVKLLKLVTFVGLIEGAVSLASEFFRAKAKAEELDKAVTDMLAEKPAPARDAVQAVGDAAARSGARFATFAAQADAAADSIVNRFNAGLARSQEEGAKAGAAVTALGTAIADVALNAPASIAGLVGALDQVAATADLSGQQIQTALTDRLKKLSAEDLLAFQVASQAAFAQIGTDSAAAGLLIESTLTVAMQKLGLDLETVRTGFSATFRDAAAMLELVADNANATGVELLAAFEAAGKAARTAKDFEDLADRIHEAGEAGRLARPEVEKLLDGIAARADAATEGINSVAEAFKVLGMKSPAELKKLADEAKTAFEVIRDSGTAAPNQIKEAFARYARAAIDANDGVASSGLRAKAEAMGLTVEIDSAGRATVRLKQAAEGLSGGFAKAAGAAREVAAAVDKAARATERAAAAAAGMGGAETGGNYAAMGVSPTELAKSYGLKDSDAIDAFGKEAAEIIKRVNAETNKLLSLSSTVSGSAQTVMDGQKTIDALLKNLAEASQRDADTRRQRDPGYEPPRSVNVNLRLPNGKEMRVATTGDGADNLLDALRAMGMRS